MRSFRDALDSDLNVMHGSSLNSVEWYDFAKDEMMCSYVRDRHSSDFEMFAHKQSEKQISIWIAQPGKKKTTIKSAVVTWSLGPVVAFLLQQDLDGPYLMIWVFVGTFALGIVIVKACCNTNRGFRSLLHEVRTARMKIM